MKTLILIFLMVVLTGTITLIIFDPLTKDQTDNILKVVPICFTALTLIVTLSLYDRFGLQKFLYEKKITAVLNYAEALKSLKINYHLIQPEDILSYTFTSNIVLSSDMKSEMTGVEMFKNLPVFVYEENVREELMKLYDPLGSLYLPKNLSHYPYHPVFHKERLGPLPQSYVVLIFGDHVLRDFTSKPLFFINSKDLTLKDFINKNEAVFKNIKNWIEKNTIRDKDLKI